MYRQLGEGKLTTGETLEVGVVAAPDPAWSDRIGRFLIHKGGDWNYHIQQALSAPLDDLQSRFYVAMVAGEVISQVMIVSARKAGILSHVFTAPHWRQRGAYRQLMAVQMEDVRRLGIEMLTLGTGYDGRPYRIYASFGFRPVAPASGFMKWLADPEAEARYLAPAPAAVRSLHWGDWADINLLAAQPLRPDEVLPRLPTLGLKGQQNAEGPFLTFLRCCRDLPDGQNRVLQSETGAVVGWSFLTPDPRWFGDVWLLDIGVLPPFAGYRDLLLRDLRWPDAPVYAMSTAASEQSAWLRRLDFAPLTELPGWVTGPAGRTNLSLWSRWNGQRS